MQLTRPFFWLLLFALPLSAIAQAKILTLDEAVRLGVENSKQLKASIAKHQIAQSKITQYWNSAAVPNVTLNLAYTRLSDNITPFSVKFPGQTDALVLNPQILNQFANRIQAQQYVFTGFRAMNFLKSSELLEKAAGLDVDKDRIEVKNTIVSAVLNLYKLQKSAVVLVENSNVLRGRQNDIRNFVKNGTALDNDFLKSDLAITQVETMQKEVANAIELARFNLNLMLGQPTETLFELDEKSLFVEKSIGSLDAYLTAITARPDLTAANFRREATAKNVEIVKGNYYPTVSVVVGYNENRPNARVFPQEDAFKGTWDAGLQVAFNLSNLYTTKFQIQEANFTLAQVDAQRLQLSDAAKMEVAAAFYAYNTTTEKIKLAEKAIIQTTENQRVMKNRYDAQVSTVGELLDADALVLQAKINLEAAKADAEIAYYRLLKASGK